MGDLVATGTVTSNVDNTYHSALLQKLPTQCSSFIVALKEQDVNALKYKILGTADGLTWWEEKAETVLAKNGSYSQIISNPWVLLDIQVKASVGGSQGTVKVDIAGG
jgi:hypothetical protein